MLRKIYLGGDMGEKFGKVAEAKAETVRDVIQYLDANYAGVKKYLMDKSDQNIGFTIQIGEEFIDDDLEILLPLDKGDIIITPVPVGSSGVVKAVLGVVLLITGFLLIATPFGMPLMAMGAGLLAAGIAELMAPDPATDNEEENKEGYLFQGSEQSLPEGNPVPVLYGELRIPGQAVSFNLRNSTESLMNAENTAGTYTTVGDGLGNLIRYPAEKT
jgi:predicted phage tail protein